MRVLVTGLAGFFGHHLGEAILRDTDWDLVGLDRIDVTSTLHRLPAIDGWADQRHRCHFVWHDLKAPINDVIDYRIGEVDYVVHLAASTHVDRSISDPLSFVWDNVVGSAHLLDWARHRKLKKLVNFSTDEVFGPAPQGVSHKEWDRYRSTNPYSATKAGAEELGLAFHNTYGVPVVTTHSMNIFGERQHWEKFIPSVIAKVVQGCRVTIHADRTLTVSGSRVYIHAKNVAKAVLWVLARGVPGDKYNIAGEREVNNLAMAQLITTYIAEYYEEDPARFEERYRACRGPDGARPALAGQVPRLHAELVDFHSTRPGHDLRYALDGQKLLDLGFNYPKTFEQSLRECVRWTLEHPEWIGLG